MTKPGQYVSHLRITCQSCGIEQPGAEFRGNRYKTATCRTCESQHPASRWCVDCADWLPQDSFYRVGVDQTFMTNRCKPCRTLFTHGVTKQVMAEITGSTVPRCGSCGDGGERLSIDHDHNHCAGEKGCRHCVRGYLCQPCNIAEGYLRTPERARSLAEYMTRVALTPEDLAALPVSTRKAARRDRRVEGANRKYWVYP